MIWRLLDTGPGGPAFNMAADEAILAAHGQGISPPTLRFYTWECPAISLGRHQNADEVVLPEVCHRLGIEIARRPTGGRAVLHDGDLTFSIAVSHSLLGTANVMTSYHRIALGIVAGLSAMGLNGRLVNREGDNEQHSPLCFAAKSGSDIEVQGLKLVGSAQVHRRRAILQQNDLPLRASDPQFVQAFRDQSARAALSHAGSLERLLGRPVPPEEVKQAIVAGFEKALGVTFEEATLTPEEKRLAAELLTHAAAGLPIRNAPLLRG